MSTSDRIFYSSSTLTALATLDPPSPVLTAEQLSASFTSGEIPIFLSLDEGCGFEENAQEKESTEKISRSSVQTIDSVCTFGPIRARTSSNPTSYVSSASGYSLEKTQDRDDNVQLDSAPNEPYLTLSDLTPISRKARPASLRLTHLDGVENRPKSTLIDPYLQRSPALSNSEGNAKYGYARLNPSTTVSSWSLISPDFTPPSPGFDHSPTSSPIKHYFYKFFDAQLHQSLSPSGSNRLVQSSSGSDPALCSSANLSSPKSIREKGNYDLPPKSQTGRSSFLPSSLSWIGELAVNLCIDQEGFRSIIASFRPVGFTLDVCSSQLEKLGTSSSEAGVVEFMPFKRETFNFHYATFDSLPMLRRITVNGDETRDYATKQASLNIKSNGVYSICGTEVSHVAQSGLLNPKAGNDGGKLKWKFDYAVEDRKSTWGKAPSGEKIVIPLTFSCSPMLLHPQQGKKIHLLHVMKKAVAPKLTAGKVEPPYKPGAGPSFQNASSPRLKSAANSMDWYWHLHRRARSQTTASGGTDVSPNKAAANKHTAIHRLQDEENRKGDFSPSQRRRRASSAGEQRRVLFDSQPKTINDGCKLDRHIVPKSRLQDLLAHSGDAGFGSDLAVMPLGLVPRNYHPKK